MKLPDITWCDIPAGPFIMGRDDGDDDEKPQHTLELPYDYQIAKYPITNSQYQAFVAAGGEPNYKWGGDFELPNYPVVGVTWHQAVAFCQWLTAQLRQIGELDEQQQQLIRLPTEAEWEKAARGPDGRRYPWGDEAPTPEHANYADTKVGGTCAVGLFPLGRTPEGVEDLAGNVWEWTSSLWGTDFDKPEFTYPYRADDGREDMTKGNEYLRVLRGGGFSYLSLHLRAAYRHHLPPFDDARALGFRVVRVRPHF